MQFHGRDAELERMYHWFTKPRQSPRNVHVMTVTGPVGIGKSRLAQQLYVRLQRDARWNRGGYWPVTFSGDEDEPSDQREAPQIAANIRHAPAYVWLGARWYPERGRNRIDTSVLASLHRQLAHHTRAIALHGRWWERQDPVTAGERSTSQREDDGVTNAVSQLWERVSSLSTVVGEIDTHLTEILTPGMAQLMDGLDLPVVEILTAFRAARTELGRTATQPLDELADERCQQLVTDAAAMARTVLRARRPILVWLDDVQWMDRWTEQFLAAIGGSQPHAGLYVLATTWGREWYAEVEQRLARIPPGCTRDLLWLEQLPEAALLQIATQALPSWPPEQHGIIARRARGVPLNLRQTIDELRLLPYAHHETNYAAKLSPLGAAWVDRHMRTWREYAIDDQYTDLRSAEPSVAEALADAGRACGHGSLEFGAPTSAALERAEQPLAIVCRADARWRFRDPAWLEAAQRTPADEPTIAG
jgi:hypothetical protein